MSYYLDLKPYTAYTTYTTFPTTLFTSVPHVTTYNVPNYSNINNDAKIRKHIVKYFYNKTINKWLKSDSKMSELLNMLYISKGKVFVSKTSDNTTHLESKDDLNMKIDFIADHILKMNDMQDIIYRFVGKYNIAFVNLHDNKEKVKDYIYHKISKMLKKSIV
jgi:hypothetical protein